MSAQNWMIGDWYQWYAECRYYPYQVKPEDFTKDYIANFEPIPLTEEILKANGFERNIFNGMIIYSKGEVYIFEKQGAFLTMLLCKIVHLNYVHELQRALRCCGLTDLANNLKLD